MDDRKKQIELLFQRLSNGSISQNEFDRLIRYIQNYANKQEIKHIMRKVYEIKSTNKNFQKTYSNTHKDKIVQKMVIQAGVEKKTFSFPAGYRKNYKWLKAAAVFLLSAAIVFSLYKIANPDWFDHRELVFVEKTTAKGQKSTITLSDGTIIRLNAASKLKYPERFTKNSREVFLSGEAFFTVKKDSKRPFIVKTGDLTTTVLGTSFNVSAYLDESEIHVAVVSGKVSVTKNNKPEDEIKDVLILRPNEVASYNPGKEILAKEKKDISHLTDWTNGILSLKNMHFNEAAKELEKWYGVKVTVKSDKLDDCIIEGGYKELPLNKVLEALQFAFNIRFDYTADGVIITGEGC